MGDVTKIEKVAKINAYHVVLFADFLEKMQGTPDGDGSLLDHTILLYGSPLSEGNGHVPRNLPVLLAGGGCGQLKGGCHIQYSSESETPLTNLQFTILGKLGIRVDHFGDSDGTLKELSGV